MTKNSAKYTAAGLLIVSGWLAINAAYSGGAPQDAPTRSAEGLRYSKTGHDVTPLPRERVKALAEKLDPKSYHVTQKSGTEPSGTGALLENKKAGIYTCVVCGLPLFDSATKFKSGTGWPSFYQEFDPTHVKRKTDRTHGRVRTEIVCTRCDAHLGHVFNDGPKPTGERHCLNSAALTFYPKGSKLPMASQPTEFETAYFAGGCFWGIEHYFQKGEGVIDAESGFMQGTLDKPSYKQICYEDTGHAEAVKVVFDPKRISYKRLLEAFFVMHDPTQLNRQGPDVGTQYRSGIYYANEAQQNEAAGFIERLQASDAYKGRKIVTELDAAKTFFPAEDYHQDYIVKTGRSCHVKNPW